MNKHKILEYAVQLTIVIIGVYLGMIASDRNAENSMENRRNEILLAIRNEMEANRQNIIELKEIRSPFIESHNQLADSLPAEAWGTPFSFEAFREFYPDWVGIGNPNLSGSMFEAAKYGGVLPGTDIEVLEKLTDTYEFQEVLIRLNESIVDRFLDLDHQSSMREVEYLLWLIREDLWASQVILSEQYDSTILLIEEKIIAK